MDYLMQCIIDGQPKVVSEIKNIFGKVYFSFDMAKHTNEFLLIKEVVSKQNVYPGCDTLYVVYPSKRIRAVWPGTNFDDIRYGTASDTRGILITPAILIKKEKNALYLCLSPEGRNLEWQKDNFGV